MTQPHRFVVTLNTNLHKKRAKNSFYETTHPCLHRGVKNSTYIHNISLIQSKTHSNTLKIRIKQKINKHTLICTQLELGCQQGECARRLESAPAFWVGVLAQKPNKTPQTNNKKPCTLLQKMKMKIYRWRLKTNR